MTRPTRPKPFKFTPQHLEILNAIYTYHLLTAQQITRLLRPKTPGNLTTIQTRLHELVENGYLLTDKITTRKYKWPRLYALALKGRRHLEALGYTILKHFEPRQLAELSYLLDHTLELNDFLIMVATLQAYDPRISMTDLQHDLILKQHPLEWTDSQGRLRTIQPDAILQLHHPFNSQTAHHLLWIELDRGRHNPHNFQKQLQDRWDFFSLEWQIKHFHRKRMTVLYVTTEGEERVTAMRHQLRDLFTDIKISDAQNQLFKFASIPPLREPKPSPQNVFLEPYWLTAYGDRKQTIIRFTKD